MDIRVHSRTLAHPARDPRGRVRHALAAADGDPRSKDGSKTVPTKVAVALARTKRAALASPGPHYIAVAADEKARRVGAMDRADSVACTRTCSQRNPAADADPERRMRAGRNVLGRVSLLTFSARAEKVSRSSAGRVEALARAGAFHSSAANKPEQLRAEQRNLQAPSDIAMLFPHPPFGHLLPAGEGRADA